MTSPPTQMQKPKRPFSLLLFFLPTSLFTLVLLLLFCNGLSFLCLANEPPSTQKPLREAIPRSSFMLAVKQEEETPLPKPKSHKKFWFLQESVSGFPKSNSSGPRVPKGGKISKPSLRFLHSNARSRRFSTRADEFFNGYSLDSPNTSCKVRFFMTWISSLEALGPRELFSMESLFKSHPDACLLILSNSMDSTRGASLLRSFSDKGFRVSAMSPDFAFLFKDTPAEHWFRQLRKGGVQPGEVSLGQNLSNLLRLAVLYKFGGVYIDTDVVVIRSFSGLKNTIGAQTIDAETGNWSRLNNAVMVFDKNHPLLYKFIEEFALTFDGNKWGHNGPYLVSRVVSRVVGRPGFEFTVLPPAAFYPVDWSRIGGLFQGPMGESHLKWVLAKFRRIRQESFAVHLWNRQSRTIEVEEGSIIARIISDCCLFCNSSVSAL